MQCGGQEEVSPSDGELRGWLRGALQDGVRHHTAMVASAAWGAAQHSGVCPYYVLLYMQSVLGT